MSVVINDFEVVPVTPEPVQPAANPAGAARTTTTPTAVAEMERALRLRVERRERLEAY